MIFENLDQGAEEIIEKAAPSVDHLKDIGFEQSRIEKFRETWREAVRGLAENAGLALSEIAAGALGREILWGISGRLSSLAYRWEIPAKGSGQNFTFFSFLHPYGAERISTVQSVALDTLADAAFIAGEAAVVAGVGYAAWKHGKNLISHSLSWYQLQREQKTKESMAIAEKGKPSVQTNIGFLPAGPEQLERSGQIAIEKMLPPKSG